MDLFSDISREVINMLYYQTKNPKTKKRINYIINSFLNEFLTKIYPFIYIFLILIIVLFIINAIQFYITLQQLSTWRAAISNLKTVPLHK
jgi:hypothetical protein